MGRLTSSVGLVTGIPITETVDQLLSLSARPRDILIQRTQLLQQEQVAVTELTASVIGAQFALRSLGNASLFDRRTVTSSDESLLSVTTTGTPGLGTFQFTPVRQAQSHQVLSSGFATKDQPIGTGEISLRFGGFVNQGVALEQLNAGVGVERGKIRITDRSGSSEVIDLRYAQTVDDVLLAINSADDISVTAVADGDHFRLIDTTGQTAANLRVQEVSGGNTAADLGLATINVAADEAFGQDLLSLYDDLELDRLNDGRGIRLSQGVADLEVTLRDGTVLEVDFLAQTKGATTATAQTSATHGINAAVLFTSVGTGQNVDGYEISFVNDDQVTAGNEVVEINSITKQLKFRIDEGNTRAVDIVQALNTDATANQFFTAALPPGGNGTGRISLSDQAISSGGAPAVNNESTIGELLATINAVDPDKLLARISAGGDRLELVDLTNGPETFAVTSLFDGQTAEDLGLTTTADDGVISGDRRLAGLKTVLLDSLKGGAGLSPLGLLSLTDRSGATQVVDLSSAETLSDILTAINDAGLGIRAEVNSAQNGVVLTDTTGASGQLIVANADGTNTADALGLTANSSSSSVNSGSLDRQTFHERLLLSSLNNGRGIGTGSFLVTDSNGQSSAVNLTSSNAKTVGDVLKLLNGLTVGVEARINDTGDGIVLIDTAGGTGTLKVKDEGRGTAASNLKLTREASTRDINGEPTQVIDGSMAIRITVDANDSLQDVIDRINAQTSDVVAGVFSTGSGTKPFRLTLESQISGAAGRLLVDTSGLGVSFQEAVAAQDALLLVGKSDSAAGSALAASSTNEFKELIEGVTLRVQGASTTEVSVAVTKTEEPLVAQLNLFVSQYNALQDKLKSLTFFNPTENTKGVLFGSSATLRIESSMANVLTSRYLGMGDVQSLGELGLSLNDTGKLQFNAQTFRDKYAANPSDVQSFFTDPDRGVAARFNAVADQLAGVGDSVLVGRSSTLQSSIDTNASRVVDMNAALARKREQLLNQFIRMETAISRLQANQSAISQIQPISLLFGNGR